MHYRSKKSQYNCPLAVQNPRINFKFWFHYDMIMQQMRTFIFSFKKEAFQIQVLWSKIYLHSHNSPEAHNQSRIGLEYKIRLQSQKCNLWQKKICNIVVGMPLLNSFPIWNYFIAKKFAIMLLLTKNGNFGKRGPFDSILCVSGVSNVNVDLLNYHN